MSDTKLETPQEITKFPSAADQAQTLIASRPDLFKNDYQTLLAIAEGMFNYQQSVVAYENQRSMFDRMAQIAQAHAKINYEIDLTLEADFEYLGSREESIMNRGIDADRNRF